MTRPRTIGVRAVVVDAAGRVALVRHTYLDHWYLPGGGVRRGESVDAALRRELAEEIALDAFVVERVLGVFHSRREGKDDHVVIFVVRVAAPEALRVHDRREIAELGWFAPDALPDATSPATRRRIGEFVAGATGTGTW